ncbi:MAG TPA: aminodeoxychorismate synthase component I [Planctomycetes bacterium]|nr:aminodeoxychorismate synthase component I [Planctomycetota bacterium]
MRRIALASPRSILLDSSMRQQDFGERDILLLDPVVTLTLPRGAGEAVIHPAAHAGGNPFDVIERLLGRMPESGAAPAPPLLAGYISYEAGVFAERMPPPRAEGPDLSDIHMVCPAVIVVADYAAGATTVHSLNRDPREIFRLLDAAPSPSPPPHPGAPERSFSDVQCSLPFEPYLAAVERVIEYIRAGDIFQANLTRQFFVDGAPPPQVVYERLAGSSPAPYSAWIGLDGGKAVLSSSMELFLRVRGREVTTRPIKGTMRRGRSPAEDDALRRQLAGSVKDRAELTMIIDLERNDLGRVCRPGSVAVPDIYRLETFPHVHHLVSTVRGELREDAGIGALLKAVLPGGSITGAPKVRAMEIINELEPARRSVYTGVIGWMDASGNAELNVAIRTIMCEDGRAWFPAGGGIVADSLPEREHEETLHKARGMAAALGIEWPEGENDA